MNTAHKCVAHKLSLVVRYRLTRQDRSKNIKKMKLSAGVIVLISTFLVTVSCAKYSDCGESFGVFSQYFF